MADYQSQFTGQEIDQRLAAVTDKQDRLVSGTNIKTVDGQSIVGGGNVDLSRFVTATANNLANYYLKSDVYTKAEVQQLISSVQGFAFVSAVALPDPSSITLNKVYLVPSTNPQSRNIKEEFITIETPQGYAWEQIGSTSIDLSGYPTTAEMNAAISSALSTVYTKSEVDTLLANIDLSNYYTKAQVDAALALKQDLLVSGTSIKTINNISLLGEGNISIADGVDGKSAYQLWLDEGNTGTIQDFFDSLQENPGSSQDYPFELENSLNGGVNKALTAEQGKVLDGKITQLGQKVGVLNGYSKDYSFNTVAGTAFNDKYLDIEIEANKEVTISVTNPTVTKLAIILTDDDGETVQSLGNNAINQFPVKFTTIGNCKKIRFAVWAASWVTGTGEMSFNVSVKGVEQTQTDYIQVIQDNIIGEFILKLEVAVNNRYISNSGSLQPQADTYVSKPISLKAGDIVKMKYNDTGLTAIATESSGVYTPIYKYKGTNSIKYYAIDADIDVVFTFEKDSVITIIRGWISKDVHSTNKILSDEYVGLKDALLREEKGISYVLNQTGAQSNVPIDVELIQGVQYTIKSNITDNSVLSIYAYDKQASSNIKTIVQSLPAGATALYTPSVNVHCIRVVSTSSSIDFVIYDANSPTVRLDNVEDVITSKVKDNLATTGYIKKYGRVKYDGITDNEQYGKSGAYYELDLPTDFKDLYIYFEWKQNQALASIFKPIILASLLGGAIRSYYIVDAGWGITQFGNIFRKTYWGTSKNGYPSSEGLTAPSQVTQFPESYFSYRGENALWVRYKGEGTASMKITDTGITITIDGTDTELTFNSSDGISTVITALNQVTDIEADFVSSGAHKFADLMHDSSLSIPLNYSWTTPSETTLNDKPRVFIPYTLDERWHSCEILLRVGEGKMYINHDGFTAITEFNSTRMAEIKAAMANKTSVFAIGGSYNDGNSAVDLRNLEIEVNSCGTAEIIEARCPIPNATGIPYDRRDIWQMISEHNPRVVLYECHGLIVGKDEDQDTSGSFVSETNMSATTDRLMQLFAYAKSKGYEFVGVEDIIAWKLNGKPLPKRCMNIMFDDFRLDNYIDYDKRKPFVKWGVKAALAVITGGQDRGLDDEFTFNGETYTVKEMLDEINNAGWYMTSHTKDHRDMTLETCEEAIISLKADALAADRYRVHSEMICYGGNNIKFYQLHGLEASDFAMGLNGMSSDYLCKGVNNFYINRCDLGLRLTMDLVFAPLG